MSHWNLETARQTYNLPHWSEGYFDINEAGHLIARPRPRDDSAGIDLYSLVTELHRSDLTLPVLVRFTDILRDRVDTLCHAFDEAMLRHNYGGDYTAVYPIKVNQQHSVVETLYRHGTRRAGLEAGSKSELMAVLALSSPEKGTIICNGYKDREYIRLALIGRRLGHKLYIVIEKLSELDLVLEESQRLGVEPLLGVRVRPASVGVGKWQNSGGEKSKFGLTAAGVLEVVERLRNAHRLAALQLLHIHLGSQIPNIRDIQRALREVVRYFVELRQLGAPIGCVDVGGGLGIDYEGTRSRSFCSMNYSISEYANNVVQALADACNQYGIPPPHIVTEAGRAMTAHHAVLVTNVIDVSSPVEGDDPPTDSDHPVLHSLWETLQAVEERPALELYHDAYHWRSEAHELFSHGMLNLQQRAHAERLYYRLCYRTRQRLQAAQRAHRPALDDLNEKLADRYFANFSLFQSIPDAWAIEQIFPVVPLHRLDELPTRRGVIEDITCDSDGCMQHYVDSDGVDSTLPLHELREGEPYLLGIFLVGAYQEILGDMHNLFGDTCSVNVEMDESGGYRLCEAMQGDTTSDLLRYVHFDPDQLLESYRDQIASADLSATESQLFLSELQVGLTGYTYLED
ncbi:MAG: arginine decarboxylase [Gammaproteobacteria bacterium]